MHITHHIVCWLVLATDEYSFIIFFGTEELTLFSYSV
jgi:hypothetical protein